MNQIDELHVIFFRVHQRMELCSVSTVNLPVFLLSRVKPIKYRVVKGGGGFQGEGFP